VTTIAYEAWTPNAEALEAIAYANRLCADYQRQGYNVTLRQVYYRFVALDWFRQERRYARIANTNRWVRDPEGTTNAEPNYKWLGEVLNNARMAGLLSWNYIVDRTRAVSRLSHWDSPADIMAGAAAGFNIDRWEGQPKRVEVWVEKEALADIVGQAADALDCPWFACRGYVSASAMWRAGMRIRDHLRRQRDVLVLYLGDHDPSGIDMTRDVEDRLRTFVQYRPGHGHLEVRRIALTMDQVEQYAPPPNPAKLTDSRSGSYVELYGDESWELDALDPPVLTALITEHVEAERDQDLWDAATDLELEHRELLRQCADRWDEVAAMLRAGEDN
jgi:hypothetical protein